MLFVLSFLCLSVGFLLGWLGAERYIAFMQHTEHEHEELFQKNPHPELYDDEGEILRGDYTSIVFDPGFDPEKWDPETDITLDESGE